VRASRGSSCTPARSAGAGELAQKFRDGTASGIKDNMALTGILSTHLLFDQYVTHFGERAHA
jgi:hypothetical protein